MSRGRAEPSGHGPANARPPRPSATPRRGRDSARAAGRGGERRGREGKEREEGKNKRWGEEGDVNEGSAVSAGRRLSAGLVLLLGVQGYSWFTQLVLRAHEGTPGAGPSLAQAAGARGTGPK